MLSLSPTSIAARLTVQVILFSTVLAVIATCVQLFLDYRQELRNIRGFFTSVAETSVRSMEESVWILDDLQINLQLEGLTRRQDIVYAAVSMDGRIAWAKGAPPEGKALAHTFPLVYMTGRGPERIGELQVAASLDGVHRRLLRRVVILLCSNGVKTFLVAGFLLLLFRRTIAGRLTRLADYVQHIDISRGEPPPLVLDCPPAREPDEMDRVATALNGLGRSGARAFADLRLQEQRLRLFFDAANEAIFGVDPAGRCTFVNRAGAEFFAVDRPEALVGLDLLTLLDEQGGRGRPPSAPSALIRATLRDSRMFQADGLPLCRPDGRPLQLSVRSYPVVEAGQCTGAVAFFADTSRQHRLEQEKQLLTEVIRQAPALILITDARGVVEY
uniref:PAS domain-containing protein n=1 Tax=uncultured Desulfobulbus sp. TaxID=239745 RepID=UPI00261750A4